MKKGYGDHERGAGYRKEDELEEKSLEGQEDESQENQRNQG